MKTFKNRLKFHAPGLAPVEDETGWYHIDTNENAIYPERYSRAFGYYDGLAAVTDLMTIVIILILRANAFIQRIMHFVEIIRK